MSTRAIRAEIALQGLNPTVAHRKVSKDGRLVDGAKTSSDNSSSASEQQQAVAVPAFVAAETVDHEPKNALVEISHASEVSEEVHDEVPAEASDDAKKDAEQPKKRGGFKKKNVNTDT